MKLTFSALGKEDERDNNGWSETSESNSGQASHDKRSRIAREESVVVKNRILQYFTSPRLPPSPRVR